MFFAGNQQTRALVRALYVLLIANFPLLSFSTVRIIWIMNIISFTNDHGFGRLLGGVK